MACDPCGSDLIDKFIMAGGIKDKHKDALLNKLKVIIYENMSILYEHMKR